MKEHEELKKRANMLRELGDDWRKNMAIINEVPRGNKEMADSMRLLCKENNQGNLVKIGLAFIAFPIPIVIDDILGCSFLAAGLIQRRIKNSALYLEDINKAFPSVFKELQQSKREII